MPVASDIAKIATANDLSNLPALSGFVGSGIPREAMKSYTTLKPADGFFYSSTYNVIVITKSFATLDGYDFSGVSLNILANDVTFRNCYFDASAGNYAINGLPGTAGLTVDHSTFDGLKLDKHSYVDFIASRGLGTMITNNIFIDTPSDAIGLWSGIVRGNLFSGSGYATDAHADAIWVSRSIGPVLIEDNIIDWRTPSDARTGTNNAIRVTGEGGDVNDVLVRNNIILGGTNTVLVSDGATWTHTAEQVGSVTNVRVIDNVIDFGKFGSLEQTWRPADMVYSNNAHAFGQAPSPSLAAIGSLPDLATLRSFVAINATATVNGTAGADYIVGGEGSNLILAGDGNDVIEGGAGRDYIAGGGGADTFVYRSLAHSGKDWIADFQQGLDKIYLASLEGAPQTLTGWQWLGTETFTGNTWQLRYQYANGTTIVQLDVDGNLRPDFEVQLKGVYALTSADFVLLDLASLPYGAASGVLGSVAPPNRAPVITGPAASSWFEGTAGDYAKSGVLRIADADAGDALSVVTLGQSVTLQSARGLDMTPNLTIGQIAAFQNSFSMTTSGLGSNRAAANWTYAVADKAIDFLGQNETLKVTTKVLIADDHGSVATRDVIITMKGVNDAPTLSAGGDTVTTGTVAESYGLAGDATLHVAEGRFQFADADLSDTHVVKAVAKAGGYVGTFTPTLQTDTTGNGKGVVAWTFSVADKALDALADGQQITQTYSVSIGDGKGGLVKQDVTVILNGAADQFTFLSLNKQSLTKFSAGDTIAVDHQAFIGLDIGALDAAYFSNAGRATLSGHGQFFTDAAQRSLYWDADGAGMGAAVKIASFNMASTIHATDILVI
jgi:VCBS repeat-containing protein